MNRPTALCTNRHRRRIVHAGFTLLEILVVMVIVGLLAGLVGPRLFGKVDTSKVQAAQLQIKMLESAIGIMRLDIGTVPPGEQALMWLSQKPQDPSAQALWKGPYLEGASPKDPWGNSYIVEAPATDGRPFAVKSLGADGRPGGEGLDADILGVK